MEFIGYFFVILLAIYGMYRYGYICGQKDIIENTFDELNYIPTNMTDEEYAKRIAEIRGEK